MEVSRFWMARVTRSLVLSMLFTKKAHSCHVRFDLLLVCAMKGVVSLPERYSKIARGWPIAYLFAHGDGDIYLMGDLDHAPLNPDSSLTDPSSQFYSFVLSNHTKCVTRFL